MATWAILLLLLMLVTGASFTALAIGAIKLILRYVAAGLALCLVFNLLSKLSTAHAMLAIFGGGAVLIVIEEVIRYKYNKAHPWDKIGFDGKPVKP